MSVITSTLAFVLGLTVAVSCFFVGKKVGVRSVVIPHVMVADPATGALVPLVVPDGTQIFVAAPAGVEPGVYAGHSTDGKKILILPPSLLDEYGGDQSHEPAKPQQQKSGGERMDHTTLLSARQ